MGLNSGDLDRYVTIQQLTESAGESGYPVETWTTLYADEPMSKRDFSGAERFRAAQLSAPFETEWEMYYRDDMDPDDPAVDVRKKRRLVYQGRVHDIVSASMIGRYDGIVLRTLAKSDV